MGFDSCLDQVDSLYAARPIAFRASPYGVSHDFQLTRSYVPYLIDPGTLDIEFREDLIVGPFSTQLNLEAVLDDSTMVFHEVGPPSGGSYTSRLRVLTRSGISIAMSGEQQSVATIAPSATVLRLDSSHVLRHYVVPVTGAIVVQVLAVSGSTISVVASSTYAPANYTVSRDGGEAGAPTLLISPTIFPFHYNGAGTLYCQGAGSGPSGFARIHAVPFSIGGSITAPPGLSWRSRDAQNVGIKLVAKIGSSECILLATGGGMGFYDDGGQMHYISTSFASWITATYAEPDGVTSFGDYLSPRVLEAPTGTPVPGTPASIVSQSGTSLSYAPITVVVRCLDVTGLTLTDFRTTRHDVALGAVGKPLGGGVYRLWAFSW